MTKDLVPTSTDIVTAPTFNLPALMDDQEMLEILKDNMGEAGGTLRFEKVKIPSGGGISFEIIGEDGEETAVTEIVGAVYDHYRINSFWQDEFTGDNNPPDCLSMGGVYGSGNPELGIPEGQVCKKCQFDQWGSDPKGGKGKACKNSVRIYIVPEGQLLPVMLTLPPTSIGNWEEYTQRLLTKMKSIYGVVTRIKLEKDKNAGGISYSKAVFGKVAEFTPAEKAKLRNAAKGLAFAMRNAAPESVEEAGAIDPNEPF